MAERKPLSPRTRFEVFKRDGFRCAYCGNSPPSGAVLEVDHITPVAAGGRNEECNLVTCCERCNSGKSDRELTFEQKVAFLRMYPDRALTPEMFGDGPFGWEFSLRLFREQGGVFDG